MKKTIILLSLLCPLFVQAQPVTLDLESVRLNELVKITYGDLLKADYMASDDFNKDARTATLKLYGVKPEQVRVALDGLLHQNGYQVAERGGIVYISKASEPDKTEGFISFFYQPRFRSVQYLSDMLVSVFPKGRFSFQRGVQTPETAKPDAAPADTGTSAYSQLSKDQDSFIFYGSPLEVDQLAALLSQVDRPSGEVLVKAFIYEVTNNNTEQTAFSAAVGLLDKELDLGTQASISNGTISFKSGSFEAVYTALSSDSRFKVVSAPSLRVKDRELASFSVGAEVPVLGNVSYQTNGQPVQSVEYKNSGVILDITPTIRADSIELNIRQQLSNFIPTSNGVNNSPTLIKRELSSVVNAKSDDVIVLGGLEEHRTSKTKSGFRWLPDFLKNKSDEQGDSDILLVLHVQRL